MNKSLRDATLVGFFWRLAERFGLQIVTLVVQFVLANLLGTKEFGTVALIVVFTEILQVFIDSGMGNALIQKKNADDLDFSTVFYFNLFICSILYIAMFFAAPFIDTVVYEGEYAGLTAYIRVLSLTLVVSGLKNVQVSYVSKTMQFKKFFYSTMPATIVSGFVGVVMAYLGYGVWSLVAQRLLNTALSTMILWFTVKWRPKFAFSFARLKGLFSYGWKLLCSALLDKVYYECRHLLIGKLYTANDLALYNQGDKIPKLIATNLNASIDGVLFPAMSQEQDNREKIKAMTRRAIKTSAVVLWPIMLGLAAVAYPLIDLLLKDEWLPCVFYMRIFCITYAFYPIHTANLNAIKAVGRSDIFLKLEIIKKCVGLTLLLSTIFISVKAMGLSLLISTVSSSFINAFPNKKLLGYSYIEQIKDILPSMLVSVFMAAVVYFMQIALYPLYVASGSTLLLIGIIFACVLVGVIIYIVTSLLFKLEAFMYVFDMVKKFLFKFLKTRKGTN